MNQKSECNEKEREHFMKCPMCSDWFDMRDLTEVFEHEHWLEEKPSASFSHVKMIGRENEVYLKVGNTMVTMKRAK
jgi:hypothetical protein